MNPDAMITTLKTLKLHGMADAIRTLSDQSSPAYQQAVPIGDAAQGGILEARGPLQQTMRADYFSATDFGKIMGFSSLIIMLGMIFGPIVAGALADATGSFTTGFLVLAGTTNLGAGWFWAATPPPHPSQLEGSDTPVAA